MRGERDLCNNLAGVSMRNVTSAVDGPLSVARAMKCNPLGYLTLDRGTATKPNLEKRTEMRCG